MDDMYDRRELCNHVFTVQVAAVRIDICCNINVSCTVKVIVQDESTES